MGYPNLAILIPTHNRPQSLRQTLNGLVSDSQEFKVYVIDSSSPEVLHRNAENLQSLSIDVKHLSHSSPDLYQKLARGYLAANSDGLKYSLNLGDHDAVNVKALSAVRQHLNDLPQGAVCMVESTPVRPPITEKDVLRRTASALVGPSWPFWALRETSQGVSTFRDIAELDTGPWLQERLVRICDAIAGELHQAEHPFLVRNGTAKRVDEFGHSTRNYHATARPGEEKLRNRNAYLTYITKRLERADSCMSTLEQSIWIADFVRYEARIIGIRRVLENYRDARNPLSIAVFKACARMYRVHTNQASQVLQRRVVISP